LSRVCLARCAPCSPNMPRPTGVLARSLVWLWLHRWWLDDGRLSGRQRTGRRRHTKPTRVLARPADACASRSRIFLVSRPDRRRPGDELSLGSVAQPLLARGSSVVHGRRDRLRLDRDRCIQRACTSAARSTSTRRVARRPRGSAVSGRRRDQPRFASEVGAGPAREISRDRRRRPPTPRRIQ